MNDYAVVAEEIECTLFNFFKFFRSLWIPLLIGSFFASFSTPWFLIAVITSLRLEG